MRAAHVYRFYDSVAVSLPGKGETVYLNARNARKLARALNAAARSVATEKFVDSNVGTITIVLPDSASAHDVNHV